jgi:hypothetical protein
MDGTAHIKTDYTIFWLQYIVQERPIRSARPYWSVISLVHRKKKDREFPVPSRDVTTKLSMGGNNDVITELFLPRWSLVSDIPAGDGKLVNLFLQCSVLHLRLRIEEKRRMTGLLDINRVHLLLREPPSF